MTRYHVTLAQKRTTVSLDNLLSNLLAIHLGSLPQSPQAHRTVRAWLQDRLDQANDPGRILVSQWLRDQALLVLVDQPLANAYLDWLLENG